LRITGSLFFGAISKVEDFSDPARHLPQRMVLDCTQLIHIDTTGLEAIERLHGFLLQRNGELHLVGLSGQPLALMTRAGFIQKLGAAQLHATLPDALVPTAG
jgi:sulfate permease, SulP family